MKLNLILLHSHSGHSSLAELLSERLGRVGEFIDEVFIHSFTDSLSVLPLLFLAFLFMEYIEHTSSDKLTLLMKKSGRFGPVLGALFGAVPQCGFSCAAANLYRGRVVTLGTLIAVFLSTSDEMLFVLLSSDVAPVSVAIIIAYKVICAIVAGLLVDVALHLLFKRKEEPDIDAMCEEDNCHCEGGIVRSAIHHTAVVLCYIFVFTVLISAALFFFGEDRLRQIIPSVPVLSHLVASLIGLIPNCAVSVAITKLGVAGIIPTGVMLSGLFSSAGVGVLVLLRTKGRAREKLAAILLLLLFSTVLGIVSDILPFIKL